MLKLYENTLKTTYVKALLYNTPLPLIDFVDVGTYMFSGCQYIYRNSIIKCKQSGIFSLTNKSNYDVIQQYHIGDNILNITQIFKSDCLYYDSITHRYLGEYLRLIKNYYGMNLFPLYNCYCGTETSNLKLLRDANGGISAITPNNSEKNRVMLVPIKYNTEYKIALDCPHKVMIKGVLFDPKGINNYSSNMQFTDVEEQGILYHMSTSFYQPFTYKMNTKNVNDYKNQSYLYLAIQVPNSCLNIPTVLENVDTNKFSNLQLLKYKNNLCQDTLFEYLIQNVIQPMDDVDKNIERTYQYLGISNNGTTPDSWSQELTELLRKLKLDNKPIIDNLGYVTKNVEKALWNHYVNSKRSM